MPFITQLSWSTIQALKLEVGIYYSMYGIIDLVYISLEEGMRLSFSILTWYSNGS